MYCLSDQQIDFILNDLNERGIKLEGLQLNLLDHICIIIEQNLEENGNFEEFYASAIKAFYKENLREIEVETILLLRHKNYSNMKKAMIISGALSVTFFIAGSFCKILHLRITDFLLFLGFVTTSLLFLPLVYVVKIREIRATRDKLIFTIGLLVGVLYCVSMLMQVFHWSYKIPIWRATLAISFLVLTPLYFFNGIRKPETRLNTIIFSVLIVVATSIQFTLTAIRPQTYIPQYTFSAIDQPKENVKTMAGNMSKPISGNNKLTAKRTN